MKTSSGTGSRRIPWNTGRLVGKKFPLKLKEIWAIWIRLQTSSFLAWLVSEPWPGPLTARGDHSGIRCIPRVPCAGPRDSTRRRFRKGGYWKYASQR